MKTLIILGSAGCLYDDLARYGPIDGDIMAINRMGYLYPGIVRHWVTLHPEWIDSVRPLRKGNQDYLLHVYKKNPDGSSNDWGGASGLFACKIGLELGYKRLILCGIPMEDQHKYCYQMEMGYSTIKYRPAWEAHRADLAGKVFSMTGWTKALLNPDFMPESTLKGVADGAERGA